MLEGPLNVDRNGDPLIVYIVHVSVRYLER